MTSALDTQRTEHLYRGVEEVLRKVAGQRYRGSLSPQTRLVDDLGFDSVDAIRIMLELERTFSIDVAANSDSINIAEINTVDDLIGLVARLS